MVKSPAGSPFCAGAAVSVPYTISGTYTSGNAFTALLSDASGSFASPTEIGTLTSTSSGTIAATIPSGQATGTGYRIRVVSSTPSVTGTDNGSNLTVGAPTITKIFSGANCGEGAVTLSATASSGIIHWYTSSTDGSAIASGTTFTTPSLTSTTTYYVDATDGACTSSPRVPVTASIITPPSITAGGGGSYCIGSTINLTSSSSNITNQYWTGPQSYYSLNANPTITGVTTANAGTYIVTGSTLSGVNLVTNGDFEQGDVEINSSYINSADLIPEGRYAIVADPHSVHSGFTSCGDHTSKSGLQMVINGATVANVNIWSQKVNVNPNTAYQYTYWVQSVVGSNPSQLQLFVNNVPILPIYTAQTGTCQWAQYVYNWNSGSSTSADLSLVNQNTVAGGNDFALDDIVFQQACQATASVNVSVAASYTPSVSIAASANPACAGSSVTFTATPTNGGSSPSYQWKLNGSNVGTNSPIYTNNSLVSGNTVSCVMTSNLTCVSPSTATSSTVTMTITSPPTATISYSGTPFCKSLSSAQPVTLSGTGAYTGGTYSSTLGLTIDSATGDIIPGTSTAGTYTVTYTIPASGGCSAVSATTLVTITALPVATFSYTGSPYYSNASNPSPTFNGGGVAGTFSSTAGLNFVSTATGQIDLATSTPGTYTVTNTIAAADGCGDVTSTTSVTIYANLTASISGGTSPICYNTSPGTLTATGSGGTGTYTYLWYNDGVSTGVTTQSYTPGNLTATSNFYCAVTSGSCGTVNTSTIAITVTPTNTIALSSAAGSDNQTVCVNSAIANITYSTTGATGIGTATGLPGGVTATWAPNQITINGTPNESGTFNYSIPLTGGCGSVYATGTIAVTADYAITLSSAVETDSQTKCINTAITDITYTTTGATGIGTAIGLPSGVTATWNSNQITISGTPSESGTFNYSIPLTGGCGSVNATGTITVNALPTTANTGATQNICGSLISNSLGGNTPTSGTGSWSIKSGGSGSFSNSSSGNSTFTASAFSAYILTWTISNGSCTPSTADVPVNFYPTFTAGAISATGETICSGAVPTTQIGNTTAASGGDNSITYQWQYSTDNTFTTGVTTVSSNTPTYTPTQTLTQTTYYRRQAEDGACNTSFASSTGNWVVTVDPASVGGSVTGATTICPGSTSGLLTLSGQSGLVSKWQYSVSPFTTWTNISETETTHTSGALTQTTRFRAVVQSGSCSEAYSTPAEVTVDDQISPVITQCLSGGTVSCVSKVPEGVTSYQDFYDAGGRVSDNCTALSNLTVTFADVVSHDGECKVTRTYTIKDEANNSTICTQIFTINDTEVPVINSVVNLLVTPNDNSCGANLTINQPADITENCSLVDEGAYYEYSVGGTTITGHGSFTALFPEGITYINWTVTDVCGHVSAPKTQTVQVGFSLTPIGYDNGSGATGLGSGIQPMQTSTHEYFVDNKTPESGYTYTWGLYESNGTTPVSPLLYAITPVNDVHIKLSFKSSLSTGNYILLVIKTKNSTICEKQTTLSVAVVENTFDTDLNKAGPQCQAGETGTPTTIIWEVTFPGGGVAPYSLNYAVNLKDEDNNQITACSGSVSNITKTGLDHSSGCMQVEKTATDSYTVRLKYTMNSVTAKNFKVSIQIDATDQFSVSEISTDNNSETLDAHGVPNTSAITTD